MEQVDTNTEIEDCGSHIPTLYEQYESYSTASMVNRTAANNAMISCHEFEPLKSYQIWPVHHLNNVDQIQILMKKVSEANSYSLDTQSISSNALYPLISIELRKPQRSDTIIIVLEVFRLPSPNTFLFNEIKQLINKIFVPEKEIFIWNVVNKVHLYTLIEKQYLPRSTLDKLNIIEMEYHFKKWNRRRLNSSASKKLKGTWPIEMAINHVFNESIAKFNTDTTCTCQLIKRSSLYCLALSKLCTVVELN